MSATGGGGRQGVMPPKVVESLRRNERVLNVIAALPYVYGFVVFVIWSIA